jgi:hypothetical protein
MAWLNFGLPLEEEWEVEKQARAIRECDDLAQLRAIAEQAFRAWVQQADITAQLIAQMADAEVLMAQAGIGEPPDEEYLRWARECYPDAWRSGQS